MDALFLRIVNMSIAASWLILAVILLRVVLKKAPKWVNVLLWGIAAFRLICPFSFESALSLIPSKETIPLDIGMDTTPAINSGINAINNAVNPIISQSNTPVAGASINPLQITIGLFGYIWIFGVVVMLVYAAASYFRLQKKVGASLPLRDNIWICDDIPTPFILGTIKPKIYIPSGTEESKLPHIIAHEDAHLKRRDHWWKPLGFLVLAIHWFNPLVWVAYILLCRDIELACDEKVIRELNQSESISYSEALLACSVNRRTVLVCPLAFGEVGVKERVERVLNYKKPAFWVVVLALITCVVMAMCFLTNPKQDSFNIRIVVPAGSQGDFVYSDEEISPTGSKITISSGDRLGDAEVALMPIQAKGENAYKLVQLTSGRPVEMGVEQGAWFKIGVNMQNSTEEDIVVGVKVDGVEVRIEDEVYSVPSGAEKPSHTLQSLLHFMDEQEILGLIGDMPVTYSSELYLEDIPTETLSHLFSALQAVQTHSIEDDNDKWDAIQEIGEVLEERYQEGAEGDPVQVIEGVISKDHLVKLMEDKMDMCKAILQAPEPIDAALLENGAVMSFEEEQKVTAELLEALTEFLDEVKKNATQENIYSYWNRYWTDILKDKVPSGYVLAGSVEGAPALPGDEAPAELTPVTLFNDTAYARRSGGWTSVEFSAAPSNGDCIRYWHKNDTGEKVKVYLYRTDKSTTAYVSSMIVEGHGQNSEVYYAPTAGSGTYTIVIEAYASGGAIEGDVVAAAVAAGATPGWQ